MPKIEKWDRKNCKAVLDEMEAALKPVAEKYGIIIRPGNGRFDGITFTLKVSCQVLDQNGASKAKSIENQESRRCFEMFAPGAGIQDDALDKEFVFKGNPYRIEGWNPNAPTYPVLARNMATNKTYRFPVDTIKRFFPKAA